jgi:hypothetical protein
VQGFTAQPLGNVTWFPLGDLPSGHRLDALNRFLLRTFQYPAPDRPGLPSAAFRWNSRTMARSDHPSAARGDRCPPPDWQLTVLHELGATPTGLIPTGPTNPVAPAPPRPPRTGDATVVSAANSFPRSSLAGRSDRPGLPAASGPRTPVRPGPDSGPPPWATTEPAAGRPPPHPAATRTPPRTTREKPTPPGPHHPELGIQPPHRPRAGRRPSDPTRHIRPALRDRPDGRTAQRAPRARLTQLSKPAPRPPTTGSNPTPPARPAANPAGTPGQTRAALEAAPTTTYQVQPTAAPALHQLNDQAQADPQIQPNAVSAVIDHTAGIAAQARTAFDQAPNAAFGHVEV